MYRFGWCESLAFSLSCDQVPESYMGILIESLVRFAISVSLRLMIIDNEYCSYRTVDLLKHIGVGRSFE